MPPRSSRRRNHRPCRRRRQAEDREFAPWFRDQLVDREGRVAPLTGRGRSTPSQGHRSSCRTPASDGPRAVPAVATRAGTELLVAVPRHGCRCVVPRARPRRPRQQAAPSDAATAASRVRAVPPGSSSKSPQGTRGCFFVAAIRAHSPLTARQRAGNQLGRGRVVGGHAETSAVRDVETHRPRRPLDPSGEKSPRTTSPCTLGWARQSIRAGTDVEGQAVVADDLGPGAAPAGAPGSTRSGHVHVFRQQPGPGDPIDLHVGSGRRHRHGLAGFAGPAARCPRERPHRRPATIPIPSTAGCDAAAVKRRNGRAAAMLPDM